MLVPKIVVDASTKYGAMFHIHSFSKKTYPSFDTGNGIYSPSANTPELAATLLEVDISTHTGVGSLFVHTFMELVDLLYHNCPTTGCSNKFKYVVVLSGMDTSEDEDA